LATYYGHGVDETTATLPAGWADRLVPIANENTAGATGWCLEVHDLAVSKLVAGRERDLDFVAVLLREGMVSSALLRDRAAEITVSEQVEQAVHARIARLEAETARRSG
jgi:hypothetical protein